MPNYLRYYDYRVAEKTSITSAVIYNYLEFLYTQHKGNTATLEQLAQRFCELSNQNIRTAINKLIKAGIIMKETSKAGNIYIPMFLTRQATEGPVYKIDDVIAIIQEHGYNVDIRQFWAKYSAGNTTIQIRNINTLLKEWHKRATQQQAPTTSTASNIDDIIKAGIGLAQTTL